MSLVADWLSTICSLIAAVVAVITLLTVYVAALELLSRRHLYSLGLSAKALGPWKSIVVSSERFKMSTLIESPTVKFSGLVATGWTPTITMPTGFELTPAAEKPATSFGVFKALTVSLASPVVDLSRYASQLERGAIPPKGRRPAPAMADASWVHFLQALGIGPESTAAYEMESQAELVNGIVPMRWKGSDLVAICTLLGFQSYEEKPCFKRPMPLPMQWFGPLGWMQFRSSSDGCVVEFRPRDLTGLFHQLPGDLREYFRKIERSKFDENNPIFRSRLYTSVNALLLPDDEVLYLGGSDKNNSEEPLKRGEAEVICGEVRRKSMSDDEMRELIWGKRSQWPDAIRPEALHQGHSKLQVLQDDKQGGKNLKRKAAVFTPCPGLLSRIIEGEWLAYRGLHQSQKIHEYRRIYEEPEDVDKRKYPFNLGILWMNDDVLGHIKVAISLLKPDGFFFSPGELALADDMIQCYTNVQNLLSDLKEDVFPQETLDEWSKEKQSEDSDANLILNSMRLCNELHRRQAYKPNYSVEDVKVCSKASLALMKHATASGEELYWAMLVSSKVLSGIFQRLQKRLPIKTILSGKVVVSRGTVDCTEFGGKEHGSARDQPDLQEKYDQLPLVAMNQTMEASEGLVFTGMQVLAVFADLVITWYWVRGGMVTDVGKYDATIPRSVAMC